MYLFINAADKKIEVSDLFGGWHVNINQNMNATMEEKLLHAVGTTGDAQLNIHVGDMTVKIDATDEQLRHLARVIDSYIMSTTGKTIWGEEYMPPVDE